MNFQLPRIKWRLQFSLLSLLGVVTMVAVVLGLAPIVRTELALRALSNNDVEVQAGFVGLRVDINSPEAAQLRRLGPRANWMLERALSDPKKFAAAHVLLTQINEQRCRSSHSHWNEMRISVGNEADFHAEQIPQLQQHWRHRLEKDRPAKE